MSICPSPPGWPPDPDKWLSDPSSWLKKLIINQAPTGIIWSAVPFSCFFNVVKTQRVAAEQLQEGTKLFRMGEIPFIHLSTPSIHPSALLGGPLTPPA